MKLKVWMVICFIACVLSSCMWGKPKKHEPAIATDTLHYTYKTFKERAADCGNKPDSACTIIDLTYPVFDNQPKLNDSVKSRLLTTFQINDKPDSSLQLLARHYFDLYKQDAPIPGRSDMIYDFDIKIKVVKQDSGITTLQLDGYTYQGGAHGGARISFINWDTKNNKNIMLDDLFVPGYHEKLTALAEKIFRKDEKLLDTASLKDAYFFKDGKFSINNNYLVSPLGIKFLYNEYEIKSYAAGTTDLFIPYSQIKSLLRPNTVVSQYIK